MTDLTDLTTSTGFLDLLPTAGGGPALLIGGEAVVTGATTEVTDPATGAVVAAVPDAGPAEVDAAVAAATAAGPAWAGTSGRQRGSVLLRWAALLREHKERLAALATAEMGKPIGESRGEVERAAAEIEYSAGDAPRMSGQTIPGDQPGSLVVTERVPVGVVAAITPWNFPIVAPVRKIAPALAAGDTVVVKPAGESPLSALAVVALLIEAGVPAGTVNVVCGSGSVVGAALVAHPGVRGVSFTGSTSVGRGIAELAGRNLTPVQLELGGKNAAYVHSADDLGAVAGDIVSAAMQCSGQRCTAISRVVVEDAVADELVAALVSRVDALTVGPGTDPGTAVGPLVSDRQRDIVADYVRRGIEEGAVRVSADRPVPADGPYHVPVVLDRVTPDMVVAQEEIFGPVLSVLRVSGVEQAVAVVNDSEYALAASVFSTDLEVALTFLRGADTGMVHVNHGTASEPHVPFGGIGGSGMGAFSNGDTAKEFYTRTKVGYLRPAAPR
ncbi:aldehyde dehydrogenase family protein [Actinophytocola gossypii]|uniref:Aldehyde dehydrogenase n=1 Tax=Actinophytocola gossypii TaxID=2812003 RepID=A0ABT2J2E7_9PSEU|nr:aldehyde dehydrogenase family protein [Actinophytocola gossypii]MCT2581846.1 aldehyde dehydrogenase [Actinophytocola gossypii]